ncbi:hypothetical protein SROCM77S_06777 [Streptomyces rochei]
MMTNSVWCASAARHVQPVWATNTMAANTYRSP